MTTKHATKLVGCYADAALGQDHVRSVLAGLVLAADAPGRRSNMISPAELATMLRGPMSDDDWETHEAIDYLNEHSAPDGLSWGLLDGDLMLQTEAWWATEGSC